MQSTRSRNEIAFKNTLLLTDFSQSSAGALAYSLAFARHFSATGSSGVTYRVINTAPCPVLSVPGAMKD